MKQACLGRWVVMGLMAAVLAGCASSDKPRKDPYAHVPDGQLYQPTVRDGTPDVANLDVWAIPEPVPLVEPKARYGNHSPYKVLGKVYHVMSDAKAAHYKERGVASWYGAKFHRRPTSSMEPYDVAKLTAAHKTLPLPSYVRVTNLDNGRQLVVRVNDRGPFAHGRIIDLSYAAAVRLGVDRVGTAKVEVEALAPTGRAPVTRAVATQPVHSTHDPMTPAPTHAPIFPTEGGLIQVGSFSERSNATKLARSLKDANLPAVMIRKVYQNGDALHRVQLGPLSEKSLRSVHAQLQQMGHRHLRIVRLD